VKYWRDSSDRLTFDAPIPPEDYPQVCRELADAFGLSPANTLVMGPDQMFWDFQRGEQVVGFDWDIWSQFMVVAKTPTAEPLVEEIAQWLETHGRGEAK
jgi:hypothetical protein